MSRRIRQGGGGWGTPLKKRYAAGTMHLCSSEKSFANKNVKNSEKSKDSRCLRKNLTRDVDSEAQKTSQGSTILG